MLNFKIIFEDGREEILSFSCFFDFISYCNFPNSRIKDTEFVSFSCCDGV